MSLCQCNQTNKVTGGRSALQASQVAQLARNRNRLGQGGSVGLAKPQDQDCTSCQYLLGSSCWLLNSTQHIRLQESSASTALYTLQQHCPIFHTHPKGDHQVLMMSSPDNPLPQLSTSYFCCIQYIQPANLISWVRFQLEIITLMGPNFQN